MVRQRDDVRAEQSSAARDDPEVINRYSGTGVTGTIIGLSLLAIAAVIVLAQNTESVAFEFVTLEAQVPLNVLLLITAVGIALLTVLVSAVWRRRRRRTRNEREELQRLRQRSSR